jgi:hypothetical protein
MANDPRRSIDLEAVTQLVGALERDLARVRAGEGDVATLRREVEALRAVLDRGASVETDEVHAPLGRVQSLLHDAGEELKADALPATDYIQRIGRMLGM